MEGDGRFGIERDIDLADGFIRVEISINTAERHGFLRVSELDADEFFRLVHHLFGDARRRGWRWAR